MWSAVKKIISDLVTLIPFDWLSLGIGIAGLVLAAAFLALSPRLFGLTVKNLRRNKLRTVLTSLGIVALVFLVTMILSVVFFLDQQTAEKSRDIKLIITERWQAHSQLPQTHADYLNPASSKCILNDLTRTDEKGNRVPVVGPNDFMTWSFLLGYTDPEKKTLESMTFFFVMNADHIRTMMEDLEDLDPALVKKLKDTRNGCLIGRERLERLNKRVGERFKVTSLNFKDINLDFEIVGELPPGRWDQSSIMNVEYFNAEMDRYREVNKAEHPLSAKRLGLIWLRVPDRDSVERVAARINEASGYDESPTSATGGKTGSAASVVFNPPLKCETAATGIGAFLDAYRDLIWGVKWLLVPAILGCMALVMSNSIGISVRERRAEMAVMKVLGFRPGQILVTVLGESLLVAGLSGLLASGLTYYLINVVAGGIKFPIGFFPAFLVPWQAIYWGLAIGFTTAFLGSFLPAWKARGVKVSEVFSKVA